MYFGEKGLDTELDTVYNAHNKETRGSVKTLRVSFAISEKRK